MDPLDWMVDDDLLQIFHCKKTEMSCIEKPQTFLNQLRDHGFVPEERYEKVHRMKSKENLKRGIYEILDWVENKRSKDIRLFWECVFKDVMVNQYPTLKMLRKSMVDGTVSFTQFAHKEAEDKSEGSRLSENEAKQTNSARKTRKRKHVSDDVQEQPGPSSQVTPSKGKKSTKIRYSSPLKKGAKGDIWTWPIYKSQLPVTCGNQMGNLRKDRLAEGKKCILADKQWFTPPEFEKFAGRESARKWKQSIRCAGTPLETLIKQGHLKAARYKKASGGTTESLASSPLLITEDGDEERSNDEEPQSSSDEEEDADQHVDRSQEVFNVTCGASTAKLYKKRFSRGHFRKSIRTKTKWMTPKDFANETSGQTTVLWRRDIQWNGKPISKLIKKKILHIHSVNCECEPCQLDENDLINQENDDECWVCKKETDELVVCDFCPRSFHQNCHLPLVEEAQLRDDEEWKCTFCMFERSHDYRDVDPVDRNSVMSYQMSEYTQECQYLVLSLLGADEKQVFASNPGLELENYSSFVINPMWLRKVADKLQQKEYQTVGQFVSDVKLIFTNCASYHMSNDHMCAMSEQLQQHFEEQFTMAFHVQE